MKVQVLRSAMEDLAAGQKFNGRQETAASLKLSERRSLSRIVSLVGRATALSLPDIMVLDERKNEGW